MEQGGGPIFAYYQANAGYVIGYNYLGGHNPQTFPVRDASVVAWTSPKKMSDGSNLPVFVDFDFRNTLYTQTSWAPHGARGMVTGPGGTWPEQYGSEGINVGTLDGAVHWAPTSDTRHRVASDDGYWYAVW